MLILKIENREFSDGSVVRTPHFHSTLSRAQVRELRSHKLRKKKNKNTELLVYVIVSLCNIDHYRANVLGSHFLLPFPNDSKVQIYWILPSYRLFILQDHQHFCLFVCFIFGPWLQDVDFFFPREFLNTLHFF